MGSKGLVHCPTPAPAAGIEDDRELCASNPARGAAVAGGVEGERTCGEARFTLRCSPLTVNDCIINGSEAGMVPNAAAVIVAAAAT